MEFYTILAEKEHLITGLQDKENKITKKINELDSKNNELERNLKENSKKQE